MTSEGKSALLEQFDAAVKTVHLHDGPRPGGKSDDWLKGQDIGILQGLKIARSILETFPEPPKYASLEQRAAELLRRFGCTSKDDTVFLDDVQFVVSQFKEVAQRESRLSIAAALEIILREISSSTGPTGGWLDSPKALAGSISLKLTPEQVAHARAEHDSDTARLAGVAARHEILMIAAALEMAAQHVPVASVEIRVGEGRTEIRCSCGATMPIYVEVDSSQWRKTWEAHIKSQIPAAVAQAQAEHDRAVREPLIQELESVMPILEAYGRTCDESHIDGLRALAKHIQSLRGDTALASATEAGEHRGRP